MKLFKKKEISPEIQEEQPKIKVEDMPIVKDKEPETMSEKVDDIYRKLDILATGKKQKSKGLKIKRLGKMKRKFVIKRNKIAVFINMGGNNCFPVMVC